MSVRYAIYYCPPPGSALDDFGQRWLGRNDQAAPVKDRLVPKGVDISRLQALIAIPKNYGFHATLKPPFRLAEGKSADDLRAAVQAFAAARSPFIGPRLMLATLGRFLALVPSIPAPALHALADACVADFDPFRAPPTDAEVARRCSSGLSERQEVLLARWGYPYVFEEFRLHMTLTGPVVDDGERTNLIAAIAPLASGACSHPLTVDSVCLCRQDGPGAPFVIDTRASFGR